MSACDGVKTPEKIIISLPLISAAWFYLLVAFYRIKNGFWPYYGAFKTSDIQGWQLAFDMGAGIALVVVLVSPALVIPVQLVRIVFLKLSVSPGVFLYALVWSIWMASVYFDPGGYYDWYFD